MGDGADRLTHSTYRHLRTHNYCRGARKGEEAIGL